MDANDVILEEHQENPDALQAAPENAFVTQSNKRTTEPLSNFEAATHKGMAVPASAPVHSSSHAKMRFVNVARLVVITNRFFAGFRTLRDMVPPECLVQLEDMHILGRLGEGAFAVVDRYKLKSGDGAIIAVKKLKLEFLSSGPELRDFAEEVSLMRKLKHKNICGFLGVGEYEEDGRMRKFVCMELLPGGSLKTLLERKQISVAQAFHYGRDVACGLAYLHGSIPSIMHRDIKPDNVLIDADGVAKITDFGLGKGVHRALERLNTMKCVGSSFTRGSHSAPVPGRGSNDTSFDISEAQGLNILSISLTTAVPAPLRDKPSFHSTKLPTSGGFWSTSTHRSRLPSLFSSRLTAKEPDPLTGEAGSYAYMAPEVLRHEQYGVKVDIFSWAIIFFELVAGRRAYAGYYLTPEEIGVRQGLEGRRPTVPDMWPVQLQNLVKNAWSDDPALRPSASDLVTQLDAMIAEGLPQEALRAMANKHGPSCCNCVIM